MLWSLMGNGSAPDLDGNGEVRWPALLSSPDSQQERVTLYCLNVRDCVATRAGGSKEWDWTRSAPAPPSSSFRGCVRSVMDRFSSPPPRHRFVAI